MIAIRLAATELRRISAGALPKLAILAMIVIPSLYAGLYVFANKDPYGSLGQVPAAVVLQDEGAVLKNAASGTSKEVHYGQQVADRLADGNGGFGWTKTTLAKARSGVRDGHYDAVLVIGPEFSEDLTSTARYQPHRASLQLITNDANNYLSTTLAKTIVGDVRDAIARQVGTTSASTFLQGLDVLHDNLGTGVQGAQKLVNGTTRLTKGTVELVGGTAELAGGARQTANGADRLAAGAGRLANASDRLARGTSELSNGLGTLERRTATLPASTRRLADGARQVATGNARVAAVGRQAAATARTVVNQLDDSRAALNSRVQALVQQGRLTQAEATALNSFFSDARIAVDDAVRRADSAVRELEQLSAGSQQVAAGTDRLADSAPALARGVRVAAAGASRVGSGSSQLATGARTLADSTTELAAGTREVSGGAGRLASSSTALRDGSKRLQSGTAELRDGLNAGLGKVPDLDPTTARNTASTIADPVRVRDDTLARAGSYGAGLAPFFMSLATWIGAYMLFLLVRPLSRRSLAANGPSGRTALGGLLPPGLVGALQVALMLGVVGVAVSVDPVHKVYTVLVLVVASLTFVAILQALNAWLGTVGEFLGLILMLVQLVTGGGTFPWETIPEPLRSLHWLLPMTYAIDGLRQTLYGGELSIAARDLGVLLGVFLVAMLATVLAARRQRVWTPHRLQPELVI